MCKVRMHECKLQEHRENICPDTEVSCLMANIGCPLEMKRRDLLTHVSICPANTLMCNMQRPRCYEKRNTCIRHLHPRETEQVELCCYLHDLAMMRRVGRATNRIEEELKLNPHREELESLIRDVRGCTCGGHQMASRLYDLSMGDSEAIVTCDQVIRREESEEHWASHLCLSQYIKCNSCPMQSYGCRYKPQGIEFLGERGAVRFDLDSCGLVVDWVMSSYEVDYDRISSLPYIALCLVLDSLDSLSLRNLSLTSRHMRDLCYERLYTKGIVRIEWERDEKGNWSMGEKKVWSFSKVTKLPPYRLNAKSCSDVSLHLEECAYYKKERVDYRSLPDKVKISGFEEPT